MPRLSCVRCRCKLLFWAPFIRIYIKKSYSALSFWFWHKYYIGLSIYLGALYYICIELPFLEHTVLYTLIHRMGLRFLKVTWITNLLNNVKLMVRFIVQKLSKKICTSTCSLYTLVNQVRDESSTKVSNHHYLSYAKVTVCTHSQSVL